MREGMNGLNAASQQSGAAAGMPQLERVEEKSRAAGRVVLGGLTAVAGLLAVAAWFVIQNVVNIHAKDEAKSVAEVRTGLTSDREIVRRVPHEIPVPEVAPVLKAAPKPPPAPEARPLVPAEPRPAVLPVAVKKEKTLTERQLESGMMADTRSAPQVRNLLESYAEGGGEGQGGGARYASGEGLGESLKPIRVEKGGALRMKNRHFILPQGTFINCIMETAVDTSVPGMTSCRIPENVFSMDGRTLLIERGSRVFGEYRGAVANGLARIFLLWTRVETPHGVIIDLNSPATDSLGRSGLSGYVDSHWWQRFGSALMFSLVQDGFDFAMTKANKSSETNYYGSSQSTMTELIREAMRWAGNIPPTLHVNQGAGVGIFVARPVDMSGVYRLEREDAAAAGAGR